MDTVVIKKEPEVAKNTYQICRLCLSEDSLDDVFKEEELHQWIAEYLSITVNARNDCLHPSNFNNCLLFPDIIRRFNESGYLRYLSNTVNRISPVPGTLSGSARCPTITGSE